MIRQLSLLVLAAFFLVAGANHFLSPQMYLQFMPPYLPWPLALIFISGVAEMAGGIGVLIPRWRRAAGWGLIALLVAVFPANVHAAMHGLVLGGEALPGWLLWWRLPFQLVLIGWVWAACLRGGRAR